MMEPKYDIDSLIETFIQHHEQAELSQIVYIERFKKHFPGEELPDHMTDKFSISMAFHMICKEIKELKEK